MQQKWPPYTKQTSVVFVQDPVQVDIRLLNHNLCHCLLCLTSWVSAK